MAKQGRLSLRFLGPLPALTGDDKGCSPTPIRFILRSPQDSAMETVILLAAQRATYIHHVFH